MRLTTLLAPLLPVASAVLLVLAATPLCALQVEEVNLISPMTAQPFPAIITPPNVARTPQSAAMGVDDDGCRHDTGLSEYDQLIVVCPFSYFAALSVEWDSDRGGRFIGAFAPEMKKWVVDSFNSEWQTDHLRTFGRATEIARGQGQPVPDRQSWIMPQAAIPIEKKYRLAISCYRQRGARSSVIAKVALTGAWAMRARLNVPIANSQLDGGYQEVNDRIRRAVEVKKGETFQLSTWLPAYRSVFENSSLSNEGKLVAGLTLFGMELRDGDLQKAKDVLDKLKKEFDGLDRGELLKGLVRERQNSLRLHSEFLSEAAQAFMTAVSREELVRKKLPEVMLVTAECLRRTGSRERAMDWYIALGNLPETQPKLREELREGGRVRALPADKPYHVQLGWIADEQRARLTKDGVIHPGEIAGADKNLLNAILFDGLGTAAYAMPGWKPATGGNLQDCAFMLDLIGGAVLIHAKQLGTWPASLGELWEREFMADRNRVNRFHCPVTGKPFTYNVPPADIEGIAQSTVLVATSEPVPTNQGPRYGGFLANLKVIWSEKPLVPGQPPPSP